MFKVELKNGRQIVNSFQKDLLRQIETKLVSNMATAAKEKIEFQVNTATDFLGRKVKKLSEAWIKRKGHDRIFFWKGILYKSFAIRKFPQYQEVYISGPRKEIGAIVNFGSPKNNLPRREFFGLSEKSKNKIIDDEVPKVVDNIVR